MKSFENKVAAITGAASGIGRALAIELARRGCHLALSDVNDAGLTETAGIVESYGVRVTPQRLDVADRAAVHTWAERVVVDHGQVNLIFNNAGVALGATVEEVRYEDFEWLMNINFWGVVYGTKAFLPHLQASADGHVVNISSLFGLLGIPAQAAYNAAKFAVRGFTESLREELDMMQCGVSATCVHPGGIKTNIARAARMDGSVNTLGFDARNSIDKFEKLFMTSAEQAATVILDAVLSDKRRVLIGQDARVGDLMQRLLPTAYQPLVNYFVRKTML